MPYSKFERAKVRLIENEIKPYRQRLNNLYLRVLRKSINRIKQDSYFSAENTIQAFQYSFDEAIIDHLLIMKAKRRKTFLKHSVFYLRLLDRKIKEARNKAKVFKTKAKKKKKRKYKKRRKKSKYLSGLIEIENLSETLFFDLSQSLSDIRNTHLTNYVEGFTAETISGINKTKMRQIKRIVFKEISSGAGKKQILINVERKIKRVIRRSALLIARNEIAGAINSAEYGSATASKINKSKVWLSKFDLKVRETHRRVNRKRININQSFRVGEDSMLYPRDPSGSAKEVINCRCILKYVV